MGMPGATRPGGKIRRCVFAYANDAHLDSTIAWVMPTAAAPAATSTIPPSERPADHSIWTSKSASVRGSSSGISLAAALRLPDPRDEAPRLPAILFICTRKILAHELLFAKNAEMPDRKYRDRPYDENPMIQPKSETKEEEQE
jgi:hypothetical protein